VSRWIGAIRAATVCRVPRPRCYVASPLGFSETTRPWYTDVLLPALAELVEPVDPWSLTAEEEVAAAQAAGRDREIALEIGRRNIEAIRSSSMLIAQLDGQEADSGTVAELGYAAGLGLRCFGIRSDFRQAGEAGVPLNLQVVTFVETSGGIIAPSLDALLAHLRADLAG
jgi:nucleoside 2-deoxyribosyltransferase